MITPTRRATTDGADPAEQLNDLYPPILTTGQVAEILQCTVGDVRDKTHRGEIEVMRWGQQFRFFRNHVTAALRPYPPTGRFSPRRRPWKTTARTEKALTDFRSIA